MNLVKPEPVTTTGSITRSTVGTYFDIAGVMQTAAIDTVRINYDPITHEFLGVLIENAATNILLNSTTLTTQSVTVIATSYTLSFYGTGTIVLSGANVATVVGTGTYPVRTTYTFTPTAGSLTLTVTGTVTKAQLELNGSATSWINTAATAVTRAADIITGSGLVYTNLTNAYAEWSSGTTYALGTSVSYGILGTYISLQNSNLNQNPITATSYWSRTGPTNKMAVFDDQISSISSSSSDIIFAVTASSIDTVALLNVTGSKTSIAVTDTGLKTKIYHNAQQLTGGDSLDWYSYFFYDSDTIRTMSVYMDIPTASNVLITIKISGTGTISLGSFITGIMKFIGDTQYGVSAGIIDYSRKDTDEFGNITFIKRNYSKRINASVSLTNANLNKVQRILYQIRATPVLWLASTDIQFEEPLITYGFYRDFSTEISYPTHSICNLQIEGLI
jgi:hypothetical protein